MKRFFSIGAMLLVFALSAAEKPLFKAGIMTDTHVTSEPESCVSLQKVLELFKKHQVDLIVHCGDVADTPQDKAYRNYRNAVKAVYPSGKPMELFPLAWHDAVGYGSYRDAWEKAWPFFKKRLEIQHDYSAKYKIAGHIFLVFPQVFDRKIYEKMISDACRETPDKPVFVVDHVPAGGTVYNSRTWGNYQVRNILEKYPQVIQLSGHVHGTLKNESNIWQGKFSVVGFGCTSKTWGGTAMRNDECAIMEVYKDKVVFRRFEQFTGKEYKATPLWCIPLPFDPATAPYTAEKRSRIPAPEFAAGDKVTVTPDSVPFNAMIVSFPDIKKGVGAFRYRIALEKKDASGKWENFSTQEIFGGFMHEPSKRKICTHRISAGFFESNTEYKISVTPLNFFSRAGKALTVTFKTPEKAAAKLVYETRKPMEELAFRADNPKYDEEPVKLSNGFYRHSPYYANLLLPEKIWKAPAKTRFRFTIDLHTRQFDPLRQWTFVLRASSGRNARGRITTLPGDVKQRYVIEFSKARAADTYNLLIREGRYGEIRFDYIKLEQLEN